MHGKLIILAMGVMMHTAAVQSARAADTIEAFDPGALDAELFVGVDGLSKGGNERSFGSDVVLGYGLFERLSINLGMSIVGNHDLSNTLPRVALGMYGTLLETDHVDLDLALDFQAGGIGLRELSIGPWMELNFDAHPDMETWGLYARAALPILRREQASAEDKPIARMYEAAVQVEPTLGGYLGTGCHQLLLEIDATFRPVPAAGERRVELGGLALGYNVTINDTIEVLNQLFVDLPQAGESVAVGLMTGFILTLPRS